MAADSKTLFIAKLSPKTTERRLRDIFSDYGRVTRCDIKHDRLYGFVEFDKRIDAEDALYDLNGAPLDGTNIEIAFSTKESKEATRDTVHCYSCGSVGHFAKACTKNSSSCYECGQPGHFARDCTNRKNRSRSRSPRR